MQQLVSYHVYNTDGKAKTVEEAETVLLIRTQSGYRSTVEQVIREHISYTNFIAEIAPESVNESFLKWLNTEVPVAPNVRT